MSVYVTCFRKVIRLRELNGALTSKKNYTMRGRTYRTSSSPDFYFDTVSESSEVFSCRHTTTS